MKKKVAIAVGLLILIAVIVMNLLRSGQQGVKVRVEKVTRKDITSIVTGTGEIKPKRNVEISSDISGKIIKIGVREGDFVKKGQFLLQIDPEYYRANYERDKAYLEATKAELLQAEANYRVAKREYERARQLFQQGIISQKELEDAESRFKSALSQLKALKFRIKQAEAAVASSLDRLKKTTIVSPIDGIITSLKVEEGEVAVVGTMNNPGTVLMTIADLSEMEAELGVDETEIVKVKEGQKAIVKVDALPDEEFEGVVTEVGNSTLQTTMTSGQQQAKEFKVVVLLKKSDPRLKPGLTATADIIVAKKENVIAVPIAALVVRKVDGEEREGVFVYRDGKAEFRPVKKGIMGEMEIEIVEGLKEGEEIIVGPFKVLRTLQDGDPVVKTEEKKGKK